MKKRFVFAAALILLTVAVPLASATQDLSVMPPLNLEPRTESAQQGATQQGAARLEETEQTFRQDKDGLYEWTGSFVIDAAGVLSASERATLKDFLLKLNDETTVQIAVLTVPTTDGEPIHDFAVRHFEGSSIIRISGCDSASSFRAELISRINSTLNAPSAFIAQDSVISPIVETIVSEVHSITGPS